MADAATELPDDHGRRPRRCLRCEVTFDSAWVGERICPHCKGSHAWRAGELSRVQRLRPGSTSS